MSQRQLLVVVSNPLGGIRTYLRYNLLRVRNAGWRLAVLGPAGDAYEAFKCDYGHLEDMSFYEYDPSCTPLGIASALRKIIATKQPALVHSQGLRAGLCVEATKRRRLPHVVTLHDVIVPGNDIPGRFKSLTKFAAGRLGARVEAIVAVSRDCAENHLTHFPRWTSRRRPIDVIPNGVDVDALVNARSNEGACDLRAVLRLPEDVVLGGFFGRFMPQKGFLVLLDALKEIYQTTEGRRLHLVVARDPHGFRAQYTELVGQDEALRKRVHFVEPVVEIAPIMKQVDVLVMPSLWEACGLLAMEAMVLGVPVIASDAIGLREVVEGTPSLAPSAGNSKALAESLSNFIRRPLAAEAAAFAEHAARRFDNRRSAQALTDLFDEVAKVAR